MNIGKWIVVAFVLFAGFIGTLVTVCVKQDVNLVSKDYYTEELAYQQQIKRVENTLNLEEKPVIKIKNGALNVSFPQSFQVVNGTIELFCPSAPEMDRSYQLNNDPDQSFVVKDLRNGMYRARMTWTMKGAEFYQEEVIYL